MNPAKTAGIVLIALAALAPAYGSFTEATQEAKIGPIALPVKEKQTVNVPVRAGVGAIVIGGALPALGGKRG